MNENEKMISKRCGHRTMIACMRGRHFCSLKCKVCETVIESGACPVIKDRERLIGKVVDTVPIEKEVDNDEMV